MACEGTFDIYIGSDDIYIYIDNVGHNIGQAFSIGGINIDICGAKFNVDTACTGGDTIDVAAKIYASTGTVGTDAHITGAALAASNTIQYSTVQQAWQAFTFAPYTLLSNTDYCIVLEVVAVDGGMMGPTADNTTPSHYGNACHHYGTPTGESSSDVNFSIHNDSGGWTGKINGISPGKVNGVADIGKIIGV